MRAKRSRVGHSQGVGDIGVLDVRRMSPDLGWEEIVSRNVRIQSDHRALTVSSSPRESETGLNLRQEATVSRNFNGQSVRRTLTLSSQPLGTERQTGHFLERCYYCKKWLGEDKDAYMYGSFTTFCTPECRNAQIAIDDVKQKQGIQPLVEFDQSSI